MLIAAFMSLSWIVEQLGHDHCRIDRSVTAVFLYPQQLHSWLLGKNLSILMSWRLYHCALYDKYATNFDQLTSLIALANLWFLTMLLTCRFSMQIVSWFLIISVDSLCKKSFRWLDTFSCCLANSILAFSLFLDPGSVLEYCLCNFINFRSDSCKNFGFSTFSPSEVTRIG